MPMAIDEAETRGDFNNVLLATETQTEKDYNRQSFSLATDDGETGTGRDL